MVGGVDDHGVERVAEGRQQLAVVGEVPHARMIRVGRREPPLIHVAQADDLHRGMRRDLREVEPRDALDTHAGHVEPCAEIAGPDHAGNGDRRGGRTEQASAGGFHGSLLWDIE